MPEKAMSDLEDFGVQSECMTWDEANDQTSLQSRSGNNVWDEGITDIITPLPDGQTITYPGSGVKLIIPGGALGPKENFKLYCKVLPYTYNIGQRGSPVYIV